MRGDTFGETLETLCIIAAAEVVIIMKSVSLFFLAISVLVITNCSQLANCKKKEGSEKPDWAKKDVRDFSDVDLERLYDQWEEDDEPLEPDELPEHLRPSPHLDLSKLDMSDPESILKASKKGKTVMAFINIAGNPSRLETDKLTERYQASLRNNHVTLDRFVIGDDRVIFMFKDGALAWEAKEYLVEQERVKDVTIENKVYPGKYDQGSVKKEEL